MVGNQYKSPDEGQKEKATPKKEESSAPLLKNRFSSINTFFTDKKTIRIVALSCLLTSAYLLIAFTSFLFTWKADQDKLMNPLWEFFFNNEIQVDNWLGKLGALVAHQFIHQAFGIASFAFVFLSFLLGIKIAFGISLLPLRRTFRISFFSILWTSVTLAYLASKIPFLGGAFGFYVSNWLNAILGGFGTGLILLFLLVVFLVISIDFSIDYILNLLGIKGKSLLDSELEAEQQKESDTPPEQSEQNDEQQQLTNSYVFVDKEEELSEEVEEVEFETNFEFEAPQEEKLEQDNTEEGQNDNIQMDVEVAAEEASLSEKEINKLVDEFGEYDPKLDLASYQFPPLDLLKEYGSGIKVNPQELEDNKNKIVKTLDNYGIKIKSIKATIGPTVTLYEIIPDAGVRISRIKNLEDDIALSLSALGIRIIAPMPGKGTVGIEVPNLNPDTVSMRTVIASEKFQNCKYQLPVVLGKTISNETYVFDLAKMPHLLMAGATGQGKSVGLNAVLTSLLYKKHPSQLKLVLVDPKKVELTLYNKIERHYLAKLPDTEDAIITDNKKVVTTLNSLCVEMDNRYELLKTAMVRNIVEYNQKFVQRKLNPENGHKYLPYIVLVVDEFADLIMTAGREVEQPIARLAQLARAIGIHLIIATQRPSTNIITGTIKANFPARIAFRVTSGIDSRTILDSTGAEQLIGRGDLLITTGADLTRVQCAFVDTPEVEEITDFIGNQRGFPGAFLLPEYFDESGEGGIGDISPEDRDSMFEEAARIIVMHQQGSASLLQRKLKLGYNRAGRIIDQLEAAGIIGKFEGSKARQVLIQDEISLEQLLKGEE